MARAAFAGSPLHATLDVIRYKVRIYEEHLDRGEADGLWNPSAERDTPPSIGNVNKT